MPGLTRSETLSVAATGALALIFIITAWWSFGRSPFVLATSLGCVGGLMHELAQSGGENFFFLKKNKGGGLGWGPRQDLGGDNGGDAAASHTRAREGGA